MAILVAVATAAGPFGTYLELPTWHRLAYWTAAFAGVGLFMELCLWMALTHPSLAKTSRVLRIFGAAAFASVPGALVIVALEGVFRDIEPTLHFIGTIWFYVALIGSVVGLVEYGLPVGGRGAFAEAWQTHPDGTAPPASVPGEAFLRQLRPETGRDLISISAEDHYLTVVTTTGKETILMRMRDAEAQLSDYPGRRIHRSHWVAFGAIERLDRKGHSWTAQLVNGAVLPVSRTTGPRLDREIRAAAP